MDVTSLNHGGQRKRRHLSQNVWVISAGETYGSGMTHRRLSPAAPVWQVCSAVASPQPRRGCQRLQRAKRRHSSTGLAHCSSGNQKSHPAPLSLEKVRGEKKREREKKERMRTTCSPSAFWHPHNTGMEVCDLWLGSALLVLHDIGEEMFCFASIFDQCLNYSLPEKSWKTSGTQELQNQTSQTHTGGTWDLLFVKIHNAKAHSANTDSQMTLLPQVIINSSV